MSETLYDQLGGFKFVRKIVSDFYDRVLDDDDLSPFFENTDMATQIDHQTQFIAMLLGGPASYTNEQLRLSWRSNSTDRQPRGWHDDTCDPLSNTFESVIAPELSSSS